ncbi:hypothetical protein XarbCFBP6827_09825 [Xanthomonas arboricola]|nr:hypothetical protein XarbCFBP6827_09825 [Xanthomonas arboricola]
MSGVICTGAGTRCVCWPGQNIMAVADGPGSARQHAIALPDFQSLAARAASKLHPMWQCHHREGDTTRNLSMRLIFVALMQLGSSSLHAAEPCRDLQTTSASNACWNQQVGISQERLDDYLATARDTAISTSGVPADAFDNAQTAWTTYRDLQCGNVRTRWRDATVRPAKIASCIVDLNDQRAHDLWKHYLTYVDRTPSLRPEPALRSGK